MEGLDNSDFLKCGGGSLTKGGARENWSKILKIARLKTNHFNMFYCKRKERNREVARNPRVERVLF